VSNDLGPIRQIGGRANRNPLREGRRNCLARLRRGEAKSGQS
jgi:hypothetical protein